MEVNFDNLRLGLQEEVNDLIDFLNHRYKVSDESIELSSMQTATLAKKLMRLKQSAITIMCLYSDAVANISHLCESKEIEFGN